MELPILLLLLIAVSYAASESSKKTATVKTTGLEDSVSTQKKANQTNKRELFEGNFGERIAKFRDISIGAPRIEYADNIKSVPSDQSPAQQFYEGQARLPQIAKISDVLTGQGPPFEVAVANHLYAPVSVYQARHSSPTDFEIPQAAASLAYTNPNAYQPNNLVAEDQQPQALPLKDSDVPQVNTKNIEVPAKKQPRFHFPHFQRLPQNIFQQPRNYPKPQAPFGELFPLYNRENGQPEQVLPSHVYYQKGLYQLVPLGQNLDYVNQEAHRKYPPGYPKFEDLEFETEKPKLDKDVSAPEPKPGYHAHPNGAISYVSYSNVPVRITHQRITSNPGAIKEMDKLLNEFPSRLPNSGNSERENIAVMKQKFIIPMSFQENDQQPSNLQPEIKHESQYRPKLQPINLSGNLGTQNLHYKSSRIPYPSVYFQRLPAFKPSNDYQSKPRVHPTTSLPFIQGPHSKPLLPRPRPFGFSKQSTQPQSHVDNPVPPMLQQRHFTPLPPLKSNYNPTLKPLSSHTRTAPVFLPTSLSSTTTTSESILDQVISSTTVRPTTKHQQTLEEHTINTETQPQSQNSESLQPEIVHQSQPTALPVLISSSTQEPYQQQDTQEPYHQQDSQSEASLNSTPQPQYQSTATPDSINTSPRHEVIIQKQELQELIYEPSSEPSSVPQYYHEQQQQQQQQNVHQQQDIESLQLLSQQQQLELEQLQLQQYNNELQRVEQQSQLQTPQSEQTEQSDDQQYSQSPQNQYQTEQSQKQDTEQTQPTESNTQNNDEQNKSYEQNHLTSSTEMSSEKHVQQQEGQFVYSHQAIPVPVPHYYLKPNSADPHSLKFASISDPGLSTPRIPDSGEFLGPILTPIQPLPAEYYAHPQELVVQSEFGSGGPAPPADVQYYGKFAHELFAKQR